MKIHGIKLEPIQMVFICLWCVGSDFFKGDFSLSIHAISLFLACWVAAFIFTDTKYFKGGADQ